MNNKTPVIDIIASTESCAIELERKNKPIKAETIRQNVSNMFKN